MDVEPDDLKTTEVIVIPDEEEEVVAVEDRVIQERRRSETQERYKSEYNGKSWKASQEEKSGR